MSSPLKILYYQQIELLVFLANPCTVNNALTVQKHCVGLEDASPGPDRKLTCGFVPSSRETGPGQRGEPGHAPGVGPNPPGAQQSIEPSSELPAHHIRCDDWFRSRSMEPLTKCLYAN